MSLFIWAIFKLKTRINLSKKQRNLPEMRVIKQSDLEGHQISLTVFLALKYMNNIFKLNYKYLPGYYTI